MPYQSGPAMFPIGSRCGQVIPSGESLNSEGLVDEVLSSKGTERPGRGGLVIGEPSGPGEARCGHRWASPSGISVCWAGEVGRPSESFGLRSLVFWSNEGMLCMSRSGRYVHRWALSPFVGR